MKVFMILTILMLCTTNSLICQTKKFTSSLNCQINGIVNYGPTNNHAILMGMQGFVQMKSKYTIDSTRFIDLDFTPILNSYFLFDQSPKNEFNYQLNAYRAWMRYVQPQFEMVFGIQKIDFGSASILRPLQWFNQIDPRDPLGLTQGVLGIRGKYTFLNNSNIWFWVLNNNDDRRGLEIFPSNGNIEFGGRFQNQIPLGEIAISYHHRDADISSLNFPNLMQVPEDKFGLDGKWDIGIGIWTEISYAYKHRLDNNFKHQSLINCGMDYTFGIGNGLNIMVEHLVFSFDEMPLKFSNVAHISAGIISYPLGFYDSISAISYLSWIQKSPSVLLNYKHDFKTITGYVIAYYNPETTQGIVNNDLTYNFSGPGLRVMMVYNN